MSCLELSVIERLQCVVPLIAWHLSLFLSTVAHGRDEHFASTTETSMARPRTAVFATRKQVATCFLAAPSLPIVALHTALGDRVLPAEACLRRPHQHAWWARPSMAHEWAWMRARAASFGAGLPAGVRRQSRNGFRVVFFSAPATVGTGVYLTGGIAARTSPSRSLIWLLIFVLGFHLVGVPLPHAVEMRNRPAGRAGPNPRGPHNLVSAYNALVLSVFDILLDPGWQICGRRL